jgi:hypothetical protein
MNRQASIAMKLMLFHSVIFLSEKYIIPQKYCYQFRLFLCVNLLYMLFTLVVEYWLIRQEWVVKMVEKKSADVSLEVLHYSIMGAVYTKSTLHALISGIGAAYIYITPSPIQEDYLYGYSYQAETLIIHSIAYFVGDCFEMMRYVKPFTGADWVFVAHHIGAIIAFGCPLLFELGYYVAACALIFELSTPFLTIRWWLYQLEMKDTVIFQIFEFLFVVSFVAIRTIWGILVYSRDVCQFIFPFMMGKVIKTTHYRPASDGQARAMSFVAFFLLIAFNSLNLFFLVGIVRMVIRRFQKKAE